MKKFTVSLVIGILALSGLFVVPSCGKNAIPVEFKAKTVNGSSISTDDLSGKVVLVNYWGTWCGPCKEEIPHFQEVYEQYKDDGFVIVAIALPQKSFEKTIGGKDDVLKYMEEQPMTFPVIMKDEAPHKEIQDRFGKIERVPTSFLFDRNGNLVQKFTKAIEKKKLQEHVKPLLSQK